MKKTAICTMLFILAGSLAGCSGADGTEEKSTVSETGENNQSAEQISFPEQYSDIIDGVEFDTVIEIPEELDFSRLRGSTAQLQYADIDKVQKTLGEGRELTSEEQDTATGADGQIESWFGRYADGTEIYAGTELAYNTDWILKVESRFDIDAPGEDFSQTDELDFSSSADVMEKVKQCLSQTGYQTGDLNYSYYALDHQIMQSRQPLESLKDTPVNGAGWTESDDAYYFLIEQEYQGIPVYFGDEMFPEDVEAYRPIRIIYSAEGIQRVFVERMYSFTEGSEQIQLLDFSEIASVIGRKYGNILTGAAYQVERAKLYQIPVRNSDDNFDVRPAWFVEITESGTDSETGDPYEYTVYSYVDAETGEELTI